MAKTVITEQQEQSLQTFIALQREMQNIDTEFPLQYAICLAEIALCPGLSLTELADKTAMPLSTVSRIVGALSTHRQRGKPYELVEIKILPAERRRKHLYMTKSGEALIARINALLCPASEKAETPRKRA